MPNTTTKQRNLLTLTMIIAAMVWLLHLGWSYLWAAHACSMERYWILHLSSLLAVSVAALCTFYAMRQWSKSGDRSAGRRLLATLSAGLCSYLLFLILMLEAINVVVPSCQ